MSLSVLGASRSGISFVSLPSFAVAARVSLLLEDMGAEGPERNSGIAIAVDGKVSEGVKNSVSFDEE